ncbi:MAG: hypothetical protein ACRDSE_24225, partial [Pseudonocardiaceae bacterium]
MVSEDLTASGFRKPRQRTWVRSVLALAGVGLTAALIVPRLPEWNELVGALKAVDGRWLAVAAVAQAVSLVLFAELQHKLLGALGAPVPLSRLVAISVSRSALALVAPAGSAVSAGFAFRQFRRAGACRAIAARVLVFAGVVSFAGLLLLYLVQFVASRWPQALAYVVEHGGDLVAAGVLAVILGWLAIDCGGAVLRRWVGVISPRAW